jgi:hypothetical protein
MQTNFEDNINFFKLITKVQNYFCDDHVNCQKSCFKGTVSRDGG